MISLVQRLNYLRVGESFIFVVSIDCLPGSRRTTSEQTNKIANFLCDLFKCYTAYFDLRFYRRLKIYESIS